MKCLQLDNFSFHKYHKLSNSHFGIIVSANNKLEISNKKRKKMKKNFAFFHFRKQLISLYEEVSGRLVGRQSRFLVDNNVGKEIELVGREIVCSNRRNTRSVSVTTKKLIKLTTLLPPPAAAAAAAAAAMLIGMMKHEKNMKMLQLIDVPILWWALSNFGQR
ncbi:hypothetical protein T11_14375 [Trichinella zimbabwensis]|uniref:Uncharacterized protein n=1 Tax=Trichinella zimbabwensis TaxID=268475 RepID=A0A0V1I3I1_9BILA|nr:hypothetical protein T11_14375 [Trichinella zimbabwensis]